MAYFLRSFGNAISMAQLIVLCVTGITGDLLTGKESMASSRMSFGSTFSIAFLFVSCVTGIMGTGCSYTKQVAHLSDVAHTSRFEFVIRSSDPQWYGDGMQLFAYKLNGVYWVKRTIKWAIMEGSSRMSRESVENMMREAFRKWAAVTPFTFVEVQPSQQPDVRIEFKRRELDLMCLIKHHGSYMADKTGKTILFNDAANWTNPRGREWTNFRFAAIYAIGGLLGLGSSSNPRAVRHHGLRGFDRPGNPALDKDDIDGIMALYGGPVSRTNSRENPATSSFHGGPVSRTYGRGNTGSSSLYGGPTSRTHSRAIPAPSTSSSSSTNTSSSSSDDDTARKRSGSSSSDDDTTSTERSGSSSSDDDTTSTERSGSSSSDDE